MKRGITSYNEEKSGEDELLGAGFAEGAPGAFLPGEVFWAESLCGGPSDRFLGEESAPPLGPSRFAA